MSNLDIIAQSDTPRLAWLLEIAGLPYRYYCGAVPDTEQIPGMESNYQDLPLIVDTPSQFAGRLNPTEASFSMDSARVTLAYQQNSVRVDSDPVKVFMTRSHPSDTLIAQLTESVYLEEVTEAEPLYLKVDRDLSGVAIDEENGTLFYIHQEPFLVTEFLGNSANPTSANPFRLKAIARGGRGYEGLLKAPIREHIVSSKINNFPIVQYQHCANWRGRFCRLRYAALDRTGRRIGSLNSKGDPNSDYVDYISGFIDQSPAQDGDKRAIVLQIQPGYSKLSSKLVVGGGVALTTGEHYFHQVETVEGAEDWHGAATHLLAGLELAQGVSRPRDYFMLLESYEGEVVNLRGHDEVLFLQDENLEQFSNIYDLDIAGTIGFAHPRRARTLSASHRTWIQYIDQYDIIGGQPAIVFEPGSELDNDIPDETRFTNAYGLEYKVNVEFDLEMVDKIPFGGTQPISTLPWPQDVNIFQAGLNNNTGVDGGWLDVGFAEGQFSITPNESTAAALRAVEPEDESKMLGATAYRFGDNNNTGTVNTPALIWGYDIYPRGYNNIILPQIGGHYIDRDDNDISLFGDPLEIMPRWSTLWYPIIPYGEETFAWRQINSDSRRRPGTFSDGVGKTGGHPRRIPANPSYRQRMAWGMPLTESTSNDYECYVAKGFAQAGERYILVDEYISVAEGAVLVTYPEPTYFDPDTGEITGFTLLQQKVFVDSIEAITGQDGTDKYIIKTSSPLAFSFGDWTDVDDEVWVASGLEKIGPIISPVNLPQNVDISTLLTFILTDPNGLGLPTDYVNTDSFSVLEQRLAGSLPGEIWSVPLAANAVSVSQLIEGILLLAGCQIALEVNSEGIQQILVRPADQQIALYATTELASQLQKPGPSTRKDDRIINKVESNYLFDKSGKPLDQQKDVLFLDRNGLGSTDYEIRGKVINLYCLSRDYIASNEATIRRNLDNLSNVTTKRWRLPRTLWEFSVPISDGIRSLLGATVLVTSPLLEGGVANNPEGGVVRAPGVVLEQVVDFNKASVKLVVSVYPDVQTTGYNAGFYGTPEPLDPTKSLTIPRIAARAFSQTSFNGEPVYDAEIFTPEAFTYQVCVAPVHKPDEIVTTTITGVIENVDDSWTVTFDDVYIHADDVNEAFAYEVYPASYDSDIGFFVLLAFFADANNRLGAENSKGNTWL